MKKREGLDTSVICYSFFSAFLSISSPACPLSSDVILIKAASQIEVQGENSSGVVLPVWAQQKFDNKV